MERQRWLQYWQDFNDASLIIMDREEGPQGEHAREVLTRVRDHLANLRDAQGKTPAQLSKQYLQESAALMNELGVREYHAVQRRLGPCIATLDARLAGTDGHSLDAARFCSALSQIYGRLSAGSYRRTRR